MDTIRFNFQSWHPFIKGIYHQLNLWKNSLSRSWLLEGNWCRKLYEKLDESWGSGQASESCRFVLRTCDRPPYPDDTYSRVITNPCAFQDLSWITEYPRVTAKPSKKVVVARRNASLNRLLSLRFGPADVFGCNNDELHRYFYNKNQRIRSKRS